MSAALLITHAAATVFMTGLVWFVQIVHYPLHTLVGPGEFDAYQRAHLARTGPIVGPPMAVEAITAVWLALRTPPGVPTTLPWVGAGLLAVVWASTWGVQVPLHRALESRGADQRRLRMLVLTNWVRTAVWSARAGVALAMLWLGASSGAAG